MPPKRGRPPINPMRNLNDVATFADTAETLATTSQATSIAATPEKMMQLVSVMMTEYLKQQQYAPPPQAPQFSQTHKAPPPIAGMPTSENGPTYWEILKLMINMGMEKFTGDTDPIQADDWRKMLEKKFESTRCPPEFKKDLAVNYLHGEAHIWWENVVRSMPEGYMISWETFKEKFNKKYIPQEAIDSFECLFFELRQGTKTVREYEREFNHLRRFVSKEQSEQSMIRRFLRGLRPNIYNRCVVREFNSMTELFEKAAMVEVGLEKEVKYKESSQGNMMNYERHVQSNNPRCANCCKRHGGVCWLYSGKCIRCGQIGHLKKNCPEDADRCRKCGQRGHFGRNCTVHLVERRQGNNNGGNLPPPSKRQALGPRVFAVANQNDE